MPETRWTKVESLFHEALRLSPEERERFLAQACSGDSLLYREIVSLLSHFRSEDELLEKMGVPPLDQQSAPVFTPGERIGLFEIIRLLGRGGMGEVYLARDPRLGRKVALKVLPRSLTNPAIIERLRREAQAASALNHPNILTIYDFGQQGEIHYMVTEFVEGASLRASIGKLTINDALNYARQIAEALKAAHAVGIVHRDIKPENIMVRSDGYIKVLDFGLAKLAQPQSESNQSIYQRLSETDAATVPGLLVGTINYMSPEQVRGQAVDQRTDIWGWGAVLYEMLAGVRPFEAPTPGDTLAAILNKDPDPPTQDKQVNRIIATALAKNLQDRYQNIEQAIFDLANLRTGSESQRFANSIARAFTIERSSHRWKSVLIVLPVLLLLTAAVYWGYNKLKNGSAVAANAPVRVEDIVHLTDSGNVRESAISPDGQTFAYVTLESDGRQALRISRIGANAETRKLDIETGKFLGLTFSRDGQFLYYVLQQDATGKLYQLRLSDGDRKMVHDDVASSISFSPDGSRYVFERTTEHKFQIMVAGLELSSDKELWEGSSPDWAGYPAWTPDGCCVFFSLLYNSGSKPTNLRLLSVNIESGQVTDARPPFYWVGRPIWINNGRSILISGTRNDSNRARLWQLSWPPTGEATQVSPNTFWNLDSGKDQRQIATVEWVRRSTPWIVPLNDLSNPQPVSGLQGIFYGVAWTKSGKLISQTDVSGKPAFWNIEPATGTANVIPLDQRMKEYPAVSPDDHYLVYDAKTGGDSQLWRSGLDGSNPTRLTRDTFRENQAVITPDGKWVIYTSLRSGTYGLWKVPIEGATPVQLSTREAQRPAISPNGAFIVCAYDDPKHGWSTAILDVASGKLVRILPDVPPPNDHAPVIWSADGKYILYLRTEGNVSNIWAWPLHGGLARQLTLFTSERIYDFAVSRDGRFLACIRGNDSWDAALIRMAQ
jgi:serine/threonine protein kinase/sugar lactone lactonase YvrE